MAARTKVTPFTRFLLMLIIVAPLAYIGASYYNGQDPFENIKNWFDKNGSATEAVETARTSEESAGNLSTELQDCKAENTALKKKIGELEYRIETLTEKNKE